MSDTAKSTMSNTQNQLTYPEIPVYQLLKQTAERSPNRIAIVFGGMELTFAEFKNLADRFAAALADLGVKKGDRVVIHCVNCPQFAIAYYGLIKIGAVFTPLSPLSSPREASYQLNDCGAETLISLDRLYTNIHSIIPETSVKRVITIRIADAYSPLLSSLKQAEESQSLETLDLIDLLKNYAPHKKDVKINPKIDLAHLGYTGGTTGLPKGVMLTHFNVVTNVLQGACWADQAQVATDDGGVHMVYPAGTDPEDAHIRMDSGITIVVAPWFHTMGAVGYLNSQVFTGNTMIVTPRFEPKEYLENIVKYKATSIGGAPQLFIPLLNRPDFDLYDFSSVSTVFSAAAPLAMPILERMMNAFASPVIEAYGLTEATMCVSCNP